MVPLRLQDVVRLAASHAPALRQAMLSALATEGGVTEASGAFDPVFFADATYSFLEQPTSGFFSTLFTSQKSTTYTANQGLRGELLSGATYSISLREQVLDATFPTATGSSSLDQADVNIAASFTQPLLRGGWDMVAGFERRSAEISRERGYESVRQSATDVVQAAIDAYWDLAFAIADVRVKEFGLQLAEEQRQLTLARFEVGSVAEVEVVQTDAEIASRQDALLTAENAVRQAQDRLRLLISVLEDQGDWKVDFLPISEMPEALRTEMAWQDALETALLHRSDLRQLRLDLEQAELTWKVSRRNTSPKLDLIATGNSFGQDAVLGRAFDPAFQFEFPGYSLGLVFEMPLGNRQFTGAEQRARIQHALAQRLLHDTQKQVASEVRDAVRALNFLADRVVTTERATAVAERQLDAEQRRLREGVSTNFRVLEFQNDLLTAKTAEIGARAEYAKAASRLQTAQGLNWDGTDPQVPGTTVLQAVLKAEVDRTRAESQD